MNRRLAKISRIVAVQKQIHRLAEWQLIDLQRQEAELQERARLLIESLNGDTPLHGLFVESTAKRLRRVGGRERGGGQGPRDADRAGRRRAAEAASRRANRGRDRARSRAGGREIQAGADHRERVATLKRDAVGGARPRRLRNRAHDRTDPVRHPLRRHRRRGTGRLPGGAEPADPAAIGGRPGRGGVRRAGGRRGAGRNGRGGHRGLEGFSGGVIRGPVHGRGSRPGRHRPRPPIASSKVSSFKS